LALTAAEVKALKRQRFLSAFFAPLVYFALGIFLKWYCRYSFRNLKKFRKEVWRQLKGHKGPLIWTANHLTLIDSFLVFWAVYTFGNLRRTEWIFWSTPEYRNYYQMGGRLGGPLMRLTLYLCRCIPFLREEDAAAEAMRQKAFEKCLWVLKEGGSVFVYPEAGRSRRGWLEVHKPKDFNGKLALEVPHGKFLCVYLRSDNQLFSTAAPPLGDGFRAYGSVIPAVEPGETTPRVVSQRLFTELAKLQDQWFKQSRLAKNCAGNDVVDLKSPLVTDRFSPEPDEEWIMRFLTEKERAYAKGQPDLFRTVWKLIAAKEAAHKAFTQSGIHTPTGAYRMIQVDLFQRKAVHVPTTAQADIAFTDDDEDKIHCIAVLRGGFIGDNPEEGDVVWRVEEIPPGASPSAFVRERCLEFIAESDDEIGSAARLAFTDVGGVPKILHKGKVRDWGVSLSHSGRYAAYSFMIS
jgi:1-acyl-sn-glycerol-3-phosphate acyltransferase/phosphopantetheinyl transferase (holo-ACP synthase)